MNKIITNKYLIARRIIQLGFLFMFFGGNYFGWTVLRGNYSSAIILDTIPLADPYATLQIFATGFIAGADVLIGAVIILVLYGLFFGRMFCSWICPLNIITDAAIWLNQKLDIKTTLGFSRNTRYGILVLGLILSAIMGIAAFEAVSPISMLHRGIIYGIGGSWAVILGIFLFDLTITKYGWCGHLCPLGAFYALVGKFSLLKVKHQADKCTNCMKCFVVCPEEHVLTIIGKSTGIIKSSECTNCARCIEVCEDDALHIIFQDPIKKLLNKKTIV